MAFVGRRDRPIGCPRPKVSLHFKKKRKTGIRIPVREAAGKGAQKGKQTRGGIALQRGLRRSGRQQQTQ